MNQLVKERDRKKDKYDENNKHEKMTDDPNDEPLNNCTCPSCEYKRNTFAGIVSNSNLNKICAWSCTRNKDGT